MIQGIMFRDKSQNYPNLHKITIAQDSFHIYFSSFCLNSKEKSSTSFHDVYFFGILI